MLRSKPRAWIQIFDDLYRQGKEVSPRGEKVLEIEDYSVTFNPLTEVFCPFPERKLSKRYFAGELAWYFTGDPNDTRIMKYSSMWSRIANEEPPLWNSNYGEYLFTEGQFKYCLDQLVKDKDTRQAVIVLNRPNVMMSDSKDKICTNTITFRIRQNRLNMTVHMRSNDVVYGLGYDAPTFSIFYEMMLQYLKDVYPDLEVGTYTHQAVSSHIYEKHFQMLADIVNFDSSQELTSFYLPALENSKQADDLKALTVIERMISDEEPYTVPDHAMLETLEEWLKG